MDLVVPVVDHCADGADQLAVSARQECLAARVLEERILLRVKDVEAFFDQRRDPIGVVFVEGEREFDEFRQASFVFDLLDDDGGAHILTFDPGGG